MPPVLELRDITKAFPGVLANDHIDLTLEEGEIHALLGENGAGKTTLMNVLYGLYAQDEGEIYIKGQQVEVQNPNDAIAQGIGMVHQHFMLVPVLTVTENIMLGEESLLQPFSRKGFWRFTAIVGGAIAALYTASFAGSGLSLSMLLPWLLGLLVAFVGPAALYGWLFLLSQALKKGLIWFLLADNAIRIPALLIPLLFSNVRQALFGAIGSVPLKITLGLIIFLLISALGSTISYAVVATLNTFLNDRQASKRVRQISEQYGLEVDPEAYIEDLPVGIQQRVEIIKLLYREADILILDEPTAVLTPQEVEELFEVIQSLVDQGKSVIFITHKLKEVMDIADRITVLRNGRVVGTTTPSETSKEQLAAMMVGREVVLEVEKEAASPGETVLEIEDLEVMDDRGNLAVRGVSFQVRAGEILGVAGVQGNGQTELVEALTGLRESQSGQVRIQGSRVTNAPPRKILEHGVAHVPEDRQKDGLVLSFPVADNLVLNTYYVPPFAHFGVMDKDAILEAAERRTREFDVRTPSVMTPVSNLSGGNQQKVIVAREFSRPIKLLIASQPTRGLDVGSIEYIHNRIIEKRDEGCAILLVSPELDEVMSLSDRIAVMYEGEIVDIVPAEEATRERIGLLMAGAQESRKEVAGASVA